MERRKEEHREAKVKLYGSDKVKLLDTLEKAKIQELMTFIKTIDGKQQAPMKGGEAPKDEDHKLFQWAESYVNELIETTLVKLKALNLKSEDLAKSFVDDFNKVAQVKDHDGLFTETAGDLLNILKNTINCIQVCLEENPPEVKYIPTIRSSQKKRKGK